jgi:hypothetical protein
MNGLDPQLTAKVVEGLTVQGSGSWSHARQTSPPGLAGNIPGHSPISPRCDCCAHAGGLH